MRMITIEIAGATKNGTAELATAPNSSVGSGFFHFYILPGGHFLGVIRAHIRNLEQSLGARRT